MLALVSFVPSPLSRCRVGNTTSLPQELRRSLRILAQQKTKEERADQQSAASLISTKPENSSNSAKGGQAVRRASGDKGGKEKEAANKAALKRSRKGESAIEIESAAKKRKRASSSPLASSSPSKKLNKKAAASKSKRPSKETGEEVPVSPVKQQEGPDTDSGAVKKKQSKRKQSKDEIQHKRCEDRASVIVDNTRRGRSRKASARQAEHPEEGPQLEKARAKNRSKGRKKTEEGPISKGKGRSGWSSASSFSLPSVEGLARLNMAE